MNALVIYRSLLSERDKNEFGYPEWDAAQKMLRVFIEKPWKLEKKALLMKS